MSDGQFEDLWGAREDVKARIAAKKSKGFEGWMGALCGVVEVGEQGQFCVNP